ncbi:MAG: hypothetical protein QGG36_10095 [Pirellulaceae bacterium]|nr:hypothetical protein [Pirellulaceae bacterium]MDP7016141.1 hypothetical protein [Pirellulaceae bacterium]
MTLDRSSLLGLVILVAVLCSGCGPSAKDRLIGRWQGTIEVDDTKVQQKLDEAGNNPIKQAIAKKFIEAIKQGTMDFELKADGSFTSSVRLGPLTKDTYGNWKVLTDAGDRITVQLTDHNGQTNQPTLAFADDGAFAVEAEGEASEFAVFRCRRVKTTGE